MTNYEISQLSARGVPSLADLAVVVNVTDHSTPPAGSGGSDQKVTVAQLLQPGLGVVLAPSGVISGATDTSAINTALASFSSTGGTVLLQSGTWYVNAPLVVPAGVRLAGQRANLDDTAAHGVTLTCVAAWAQGGAPTAAAIVMNGNDSACTMLNVNCNFIAASLDGVGGSGSNVILADLNIYGGATNGVNQGGLTWRGERLMANQCQVGFAVNTDSDYTDCIASACQDGWYANAAINTRLIAPRAEWNTRYGYHISGTGAATGGISLIGPSTDRNASSALYVDATGNWPVLVSAPMFRRDGSDGTSPAIEVAATATSPVVIDGLTVFPGFNDDGSGNQGPVTGIKIDAGATYVSVTAAMVHAVTTPVSGTITQVRSVGTRTGAWNSPSAVTMLPEPQPGSWQPPDNGLLGANFALSAVGGGGVTLVAGTLYLAKLYIRQPVTISNLNFMVYNGGSGASTHTFVGLYSSAGTLLTGSSDKASVFQGFQFTYSLTTAQTLAAGTFVWAAVLCNMASTQPQLANGYNATINAYWPNMGQTAATFNFAANGTSLTALPGSITPASNDSASAAVFWCGFS